MHIYDYIHYTLLWYTHATYSLVLYIFTPVVASICIFVIEIYIYIYICVGVCGTRQLYVEYRWISSGSSVEREG